MLELDLPLTIAWFLASLFITFATLVALFVYAFPFRPVIWKCSDYVYFIVAILAAILGIVEQSSRETQSEAVQHRMERNELADQIASTLVYFQGICDQQAEQARREQERREGIIRPSDEFFEFSTPPMLSDEVCGYVHKAYVAPGILPGDLAGMGDDLDERYYTADEALRECAPYFFPEASDQEIYHTQLVEPGRRMFALCEEIKLAQDRLIDLERFGPIGGWWPVLLGFAFGVRLARVQADVREAIPKKAASQNGEVHMETTVTEPHVEAVPQEATAGEAPERETSSTTDQSQRLPG